MDKTLGEVITCDNKKNSLLTALKEAQETYGYFTEGLINEIAKRWDTPVSEVYGLVTFYSFLSSKPLGRNIIRVCKSLPCYLKNHQFIVELVARELNIKPGETTSDGKFSLQVVNCIGVCDKAPAMMVNDTVYADLTPKKVLEILNSHK